MDVFHFVFRPSQARRSSHGVVGCCVVRWKDLTFSSDRSSFWQWSTRVVKRNGGRRHTKNLCEITGADYHIHTPSALRSAPPLQSRLSTDCKYSKLKGMSSLSRPSSCKHHEKN